jgi:hypothetical protein
MAVVETESGGESGALNAAVAVANAPLIACFDPRSEFTSDALLRLVGPLMAEDERVIGVCGTAPPEAASGVAGLIGGLEALRTWMERCAGFAGRNRLVPVPGAAVVLDRGAVEQAGGFRHGLLELAVRLHRKARKDRAPYRMALVPEAISYSLPARSFAELREAGVRDQREIARAARSALSPPVAGLVGQRVLAPIAETAALLLLALGIPFGLVGWELAGLVLISTVALGILASWAALAFRELAKMDGSDPGRLAGLFFAALVENVGYRQCRNLWLIAGFFRA